MRNKIFTSTAKFFTALFCILAASNMNAQCNASFTYSFGPSGLVSFYSTSTGTSSNTQYFWNFGNGQGASSFSNAASTTYTTNQVYSVTLHISDSTMNCFANSTQSVVINTMGCNHVLVINHAMGSNGNVSFSSNANFPNLYHSWAFGDGGTSTAMTPNHSYALSGVYVATLTVNMLNSLCTYTATKTLSVNVAPCSLNANFNFTIGNNGNVSFASTSTGTSSNTQYSWNFGDGNYGNGITTSHLYGLATSYNVMLTVSDTANTNCIDTVMKVVNVSTAPCLNNTSFIVHKDSSQALTWKAYPSYPGNVSAVVWTWGDGTSSNGMYPSHTYSAAGVYSICVSSTLSCGSSTTFCINSNIFKSSENNAMVQLNVVNNNPVGLIQSQASDFSVQLFPNPSSGENTISIKGAKAEQLISISVYDMLGKIKYEKTSVAASDEHIEKLDLSSIPDGIYFVKVLGATEYTTKLILHK